MNKICPFWARTTKVFVYRGYLSRVNQDADPTIKTE